MPDARQIIFIFRSSLLTVVPASADMVAGSGSILRRFGFADKLSMIGLEAVPLLTSRSEICP
jgi:hypothetical protein